MGLPKEFYEIEPHIYDVSALLHLILSMDEYPDKRHKEWQSTLVSIACDKVDEIQALYKQSFQANRGY